MYRLSASVLFLALLLTGCGEGPPRVSPADERKEAVLATFRTQLKVGQEAFDAKRHDEAVNTLTKATELMPDDRDARDLLTRAVEARRQALYDRAMAAGQDALKAKDHERAVAAFSEALENKTGDKEATRCRGEAEFSLRLEQGSTAMAAKRYEDAVKAYLAASESRPDNMAVRNLLKKAQDARAQQIKEQFAEAMTAGDQSLAREDYPAALDSFTRALALVPGDEAAAKKKKEAEFHVQLQRGQKALNEKRFREAVTALEAAARLKPGNKTVVQLLEQAREERKKEIKAEYARAISSGKSALSSRKYDEAISRFKEARGLLPEESEAGSLLSDAESKKRVYDSQLSTARSALSSRRYDDAIREARAAEALAPAGSSEPGSVIRDAESKKRDYQSRLSSAQSALSSGRYDDAVRYAREAEGLSPFGSGAAASSLRSQAESKKRDQDRRKAEEKRREDERRQQEQKRREEEMKRREEELKQRTKRR